MKDDRKAVITKCNGTAVAGMVMAVIIAAIIGITICVKHVINADLFE
jgi:hypothetical protein